MMSEYMLVLFVIFCISSTYHGVKAKSSFVDFVDCVDIYKQPALQHPLLQNHKIQIEPNFKKEGDRRTYLRHNKGQTLGFSHDNVCPNGSVPIQRIPGRLIQPQTFDYPGQHYATLNTGLDPKTYHGAIATMDVEKPVVGQNEFSGGQIWIANGPKAETNIINVGWMVYPKIYGDDRSRITGYWTGNGYQNGCYNTICPGFVQIDRQVYMGHPFLKVSGKERIAHKFSLLQDPETGNWWFKFDDTRVGYWPNELFTHLKRGAASIEFGGIVVAPQGESSPPMGRGTFPSGNSSLVCSIKTIESNYDTVDFNYSNSATFVDSPNCYGLRHWTRHPTLGEMFSFGGPGGQNCGF